MDAGDLRHDPLTWIDWLAKAIGWAMLLGMVGLLLLGILIDIGAGYPRD
jgi:hypothetical protein